MRLTDRTEITEVNDADLVHVVQGGVSYKVKKENLIKSATTSLENHKNDTANPHGVTKTQVELGNVDNTSDADKPISNATLLALNDKLESADIADFETTAQLNARDTANRHRPNHTGTQLAATISDFFAQVRATVLTGISFVTASAVTATDTILQAIGKLQAQVTINNAKVTNATHTGDVTGATALTIANKAVTNAKLADVATAIIKGRKTAGTGVVEDLSAADVRTLLNVEDGAQKNVKPSWTAPVGDPKEIENKPSQLNFSIYNQNKTNKKVISTTTKSSVIVATTGVKSVPSYALNDSFIGRVFGFFDNAGTARTVQVFFTIGNREYSTSITATETGLVPFQIDYAINFPIAREANISGIIRVGAASKAIDLDFAIITGLEFDIQTTLSGGTLTINSSYLHRNHNG